MKLILLNGPPRSGKDEAAKILKSYLVINTRVYHEKFSAPIKRAFASAANARIENFNVDYYEEHKEEVIPWLGVSYRQWQIDFSEKFMKPLYGENIFGRMLLDRLEERKHDGAICIVSDCGFQIEFETLLAAFDPADILLIRLYREGCSFKGDSREYVDPWRRGSRGIDEPRCSYTPLCNFSTLEKFRENLIAIVTPFLEQTDA